MNNTHVVITGGASGLGLGCALQFARRGAAVTIVDIDTNAGALALQQLRAQTPDAPAPRFESVDLADPASVAALAQRLLTTGTPIDVLVNNAGIYPPAQRVLSSEGQELTFAIALLGHFRLTHALWPLLRQAPAARVIGVTSLVQRRAQLQLDDLRLSRDYNAIRAYQQAKLACLLFSLELQRRLEAAGSAIRSYAAHPGVCRTPLARNRRRADDDSAWQRVKSAAMAWGMSHYGQRPEQGAASIVEAALTPLPGGHFFGPGGWLEFSGAPTPLIPGPAASDPALAQALWAAAEDLTGIRWCFDSAADC